MVRAITKTEAKRFIKEVRKAHDIEIAKVYATKDVVDNTKNGLTPQLPNDETKYLNGKGEWTIALPNPGRGLDLNENILDVDLSYVSIPANDSTFNVNRSIFNGNCSFNDNFRIYSDGIEIGNIDRVEYTTESYYYIETPDPDDYYNNSDYYYSDYYSSDYYYSDYYSSDYYYSDYYSSDYYYSDYY